MIKSESDVVKYDTKKCKENIISMIKNLNTKFQVIYLIRLTY
ncbi:hypothetical protein [Haloimpatiens massiliensis]|nr:hypothetical protein [Haloimpatiens massiliensis]